MQIFKRNTVVKQQSEINQPRRFTTGQYLAAVGAMLLSITAISYAAGLLTLTQFTSGSPLSSSAVNENFQKINDELNATRTVPVAAGTLIKYTRITASDAAWARQAGTTLILVLSQGGAGGGGGGGGGDGSGSYGNGGLGGQAAPSNSNVVSIASPPTTMVATVGTGGGGGGGGDYNTSGGNGGTGGTSTFNGVATALGGAGGSGGAANTNSGSGTGGTNGGSSALAVGGAGGAGNGFSAPGGAGSSPAAGSLAGGGGGGGGLGGYTPAGSGAKGSDGVIQVWEYK